jgi:hypothetical protein
MAFRIPAATLNPSARWVCHAYRLQRPHSVPQRRRVDLTPPCAQARCLFARHRRPEQHFAWATVVYHIDPLGRQTATQTTHCLHESPLGIAAQLDAERGNSRREYRPSARIRPLGRGARRRDNTLRARSPVWILRRCLGHRYQPRPIWRAGLQPDGGSLDRARCRGEAADRDRHAQRGLVADPLIGSPLQGSGSCSA